MAPAKRMRRSRAETIKSQNSAPPVVPNISKYFLKTDRQGHQKQKDENTTQDPLPCHQNSATFNQIKQQQLGVQSKLRGKVELKGRSSEEPRLYKEVEKQEEVTDIQTKDKQTQQKIPPEEDARNLGPKSRKD